MKEQFPDTVVFFRLGYCYESFDDAKVTGACNIVLTARYEHRSARAARGRVVPRGRNVLEKLISAD